MPLWSSMRPLVVCQLVLLLLVQDSIWVFPQAFGSAAAPQTRSAALSPQRDFPWVSLKLYRGPDDGAQNDSLLQNQDGPVLSMQAGDFDEDGVRDLITAVETASGGTIRFHRGNLDAIYPHSASAQERKLQGTFTDRPLFEPLESTALSFVPELTAAADFNGDGHLDLAAASIGELRLHFLVGDGSGRLSLERSTDLGLPITHLVAEDVNRRDGIKDLIVGLSGERSEVRVYEGPHGALTAQPEVFEIDGPLSALAVGQLDDDPAIDIAAASGNELSLIRGRDRRLSISRPSEAVAVDAYQFAFQILQLVVGDFTGDNRYELAALAEEGEVQLISLVEADAFPSTTLWRQPSPSPATLSGLVTGDPGARRLVAARVSAFPKQDLIILEPGRSRVAILVENRVDESLGSTAEASSLEVYYAVNDNLTAVFPMRLSPDALEDLVLATSSDNDLLIAQSTPNKTYTVNSNLAGNDSTPDDGICDFDPPNKLCNWTSAVRSANGTPGLDKIDFAIDAVDAPFVSITEPLVVDGTSQGRVAFSGSITLTQVGNTIFRGLAFHGSNGRLTLRDFGDNIVENNYFGTIDGLAAESRSLLIIGDSSRNQIGGTTPEARNVIGPTTGGAAVTISGTSTDNVFEGNFVGVDTTGLSLIGGANFNFGISISAGNNIIGSLSPGGRNVIGGNPAGIRLVTNAVGNLVQGNYIGTDQAGTAALGNGDGIQINNANGNTIGGTIAAVRNIISGNTSDGIELLGTSSENLIQGNFIGVDVAGSADLGNAFSGVRSNNGQTFDNTIGGDVDGAGNVISGNDRTALWLTVNTTTVQNNLVGTEASGQQVIGNGQSGIFLRGTGNTIGGENAGNVIVGSAGDGITVDDGNQTIQGNFIGTNAEGTLVGGNGLNGVLIIRGVDTVIGGTEAGQGNVIAYNSRNGVTVAGSAAVTILGNSIFSNGQQGLQVNLGGDVSVPPVITSVGADSIEGSLSDTPDSEFRIEIFSSAECDPSGFGEGETFLGAVTAMTDGTGETTFSAPFTLQGPAVTATSTDPEGITSAFSNCLEVPLDKATITSILPDPNLGFPAVKPDLTVPFTEIGVTYTLVTDTGGTVVLRVLGDGDPNNVLGEVQQSIVVTEQQPSGSLLFPVMTASNVVAELNSLSVRAFIKPDNSENFTAASTPVLYDRGDAVGFVVLSPEPVSPLTAKESVTFVTTVQARLASANEGFVELQIRDSDGDLLIEPPFLPISFGLNTVQLEATVVIPDDSNRITLDALLTSGSGVQTITDPSIAYNVNRIRMENINPLSTMLLQGGREQTFEATVDYNIATETNQGSILLTLLDSDGNLIDPLINGTDQVDGLSSGPGQVDLSTRIFIPEDTIRLQLVAVLVDLAGAGAELARDESTYQFTLAGRVLILSSGPEIPLVKARVTAEPLVGDIIEDFTDSDGIYRLSLPRGTYKLTAEPPQQDRGFRLPEEMFIDVDESRNSLPDFELGTVNRQDEVLNLALALGMPGGNSAALSLINSLGLFPARPYDDEVAQLNSFANSQPSAPEETEEGLYRLFLATRAAQALANDANGLLSNVAGTVAGVIPGVSLLKDFDEKIKEAVGRLIRNQTTRVAGQVIESSSMETMFTGVLTRASSLVDSLRSHLLNFLMNSLSGGPTSWAPRFKKVFEIIVGKLVMGSGVGSFLTPGGEVTKQLTSIVQEVLLAFYAYLTDVSISQAVTSAQGFEPADDGLRLDQTAVNAAITASHARSASIQSQTVEFVADWFASMKNHADIISAVLAPFLAFPPTAPLVVPLHVTLRRFSTFLDYFGKFLNAKKFIDSSQRVYLQIPGELDRTVRKAFGHNSSSAQQTFHQFVRAPIPPAGVAADSRADFLLAGSDFQAKLDQAIQFVNNNQFQELVDHVPLLLESDAAFDAELRAAIGPVLGVMIPTIEQDPDSQGIFESIFDNTIFSISSRFLLYFNIVSFVSDATEIDSFEDPDYLERKAEMLAALVGVRDTVDVLRSSTAAANEAAAQAGTGVATAVITTAAAMSSGVHITSVSPGPVSFDVVAEITNVSDQSIAGLEAEIPTLDEALGLSFQSPQRVSLPTLDPAQSTQVNWQLTFDPAEKPSAVPLIIRLEVTPEDAAFIPGSFQVVLPVVETADADQDGLPDGYEAEFGLGVNQVSSHTDKDGDGLLNYSEYLIGTVPDDSDSDDDGATDGAEVEAGSDPLDADSTPESVARDSGDVNKDGDVNIQDVIFLLRYLSGEGPPPFPLSLGDVNGDEKVDINDVTLLLNQTVQGQ